MRNLHVMVFALLTGILVVSGCAPLICESSKQAKPLRLCRNPEYGAIMLLRDSWGVPHVFSDTDAGAMYGLGYATAEDRAFQMYYNLRIIQGRLAELIGNVKIGATRQNPHGRNSALRSDIKMRTIGYYRTARQVADNLDAETLRLLQAYSDGINNYVNSHPDKLLYLFEKLDLQPEPWTPAACIVSWWRLGLFFSGDGLRDMGPYYEITEGRTRVLTFDPTDSVGPLRNRPVRDDASVIQRSDVPEEWARKVTDYAIEHNLVRKVRTTPTGRSPRGPRFSHAWVVGGKKTTDGCAVLVSDPQTPVRNPSLFYEFHLSGETFNARGIGVAGSPIILIGFSKHVAWGMTALGADQADLFVLRTDPNHPGRYFFDGEWLDMNVRNEEIKVKDARSQTITVRQTHIGPVVTPLATQVRTGDEVALKSIPICETNRDTFQAALRMMRAKNVSQFLKATEAWRFPSANCVSGDRSGNTAFKTILALPIRSRHALLEGQAAHDGSDSNMDWQEILPSELLPQVVNPAQGWFVSANHRPIASFYPLPMGISTGSLGDTDRSWRLKETIRMKEIFRPEDVLEMHYDTVSPIKRDIVKLGYHLRDVIKYSLGDETLNALAYLEPWHANGAKSKMSVKGTEILNIMPLAFRRNFAAAAIYGGGLSGLCNMLQTVDSRIAENPNAPLIEEEAEYINLILRAAWRYAKANYGDDPNKWQQQAGAKLLRTKLPYFSTLDGFGSLDEDQDLTVPSLDCIDGGTIQSQLAQSYTQYVPLSNADQSLALLPIGQSEHPDSPYRISGYQLWSKGKLRPAPLSWREARRFVKSQKAL
ncbi:MAG: penicillin acylase family protein [Phycisphaerales bacterium]|nr:MAG: penicillin acylase family protein [Phycisphaerales bacterium]